jgi:hypothetical protein
LILRQFGVEERAFRLTVAGWREVEKRCDAGLPVIAARMAPLYQLLVVGLNERGGGLHGAIASGLFGSARLDDVRELLIQGLIGGGITSTEAGALVRRVFDEAIEKGAGPFLEFLPLAYDIANVALIGLPDEAEVGEPKGARAKTPTPRSPTVKTASPASTAPGP